MKKKDVKKQVDFLIEENRILRRMVSGEDLQIEINEPSVSRELP